MEAKSLELCRKLLQGGHLDKAGEASLRLTRRHPREPGAWCMLAAVRRRQGKIAECVAHLRRAIELMPTYIEALQELAPLLAQQGDIAGAVPLFERLYARAPSDVLQRMTLCDALVMLAREHLASGAIEPAQGAVERALSLSPDHPQANYTAGNLAGSRHDWQAAIAHYLRASAYLPQAYGLMMNLGTAWMRTGQVSRAEASYREAVRLSPSDPTLLACLASARIRLGSGDDAAELLERALAIDPENAPARYFRAELRLMLGDLRQGFAEYECRRQAEPRDYPQPRWDGGRFDGKTLLLWAEQGLGDVIQFGRFLKEAKRLGGRVILECHPPLVPLFAHCEGVDEVVAKGVQGQGDQQGKALAFDLHAPLLSVPSLLGTDLDTLPRVVPYLTAGGETIETWRRRRVANSFHIGVCWRGNPTNPTDFFRSFPFCETAPLQALPGVTLVLLQKGEPNARLDSGVDDPRFLDWGLRFETFADTAAAIRALDLVITCDTSIAHLAGALGAETWLALPVAAEWRWMRDRSDSPWYPTMQIFRQEQEASWGSVFAQMADRLAMRLTSHAGRA